MDPSGRIVPRIDSRVALRKPGVGRSSSIGHCPFSRLKNSMLKLRSARSSEAQPSEQGRLCAPVPLRCAEGSRELFSLFAWITAFSTALVGTAPASPASSSHLPATSGACAPSPSMGARDREQRTAAIVHGAAPPGLRGHHRRVTRPGPGRPLGRVVKRRSLARTLMPPGGRAADSFMSMVVRSDYVMESKGSLLMTIFQRCLPQLSSRTAPNTPVPTSASPSSSW